VFLVDGRGDAFEFVSEDGVVVYHFVYNITKQRYICMIVCIYNSWELDLNDLNYANV